MATMTPSSLLKTLLNVGLNPTQATLLDNAFCNEKDFLGGLEQIARILAIKEPPGATPSGKPWSDIHAAMLSIGDAQQGYLNALNAFDAALQLAISDLVNLRVREILDWMQQSKNTNGKQAKTKDYLQALRMLGYTFKLNMCSHDIEVNGKKITDPLRAVIANHMRDGGFESRQRIEDAYLEEAWNNRYHPIREYLLNLKYDGGSHIETLATYFQDEYNVFHIWLRRWLIGAVAKTMAAEQNRMLVLDGPQNIGKSEFAKWLCSGMPEYFYEGPINTDDKDSWKRLMQTWIWEVGELGSTTRKADREALKAFLTTREVTVRKAFDKFDTQGPAMASFIGTVNNEAGLLNDPTGSRRFMVAKLTNIIWDYKKDVDVDQVWAEAVTLYLDGEPWNLTPDERQKANEINEEYETDNPLEGLLKKYFRVDAMDMSLWIPSTDIMQTLYDRGYRGHSPKSDLMDLGAVMTKLKCIKKKHPNKNGQLVNGYHGLELFP
jgi:hypothetical protein